MSGYNKFDSESYSEESYPITESEQDEVMRLMAEEGYHDWSEQLDSELEASAWRGSKLIGGILIKKACGHSTCSHFNCERGLRIGGIEI
ncbi:MAG: hypothetical protein ACJ74G_13510 [Blastocatellia bacterium]